MLERVGIEQDMVGDLACFGGAVIGGAAACSEATHSCDSRFCQFVARGIISRWNRSCAEYRRRRGMVGAGKSTAMGLDARVRPTRPGQRPAVHL